MYLKTVRVLGFSTFNDTGWVELSPKINIVAGKNNSGKSSFLRAISGGNLNNPHRSANQFLPGSLPNPEVMITIQTSVSEIKERLKATGRVVTIRFGGPTVADQEHINSYFESDRRIEIIAQKGAAGNFEANGAIYEQSPRSEGNYGSRIYFRSDEFFSENAGRINIEETQSLFVGDQGKVFFFPAERYHRSRVSYGRYEELSPDTSNLAGFLQFLQGNDISSFTEIVDRLKQIIPNIEDLSIDTLSDGFEILIWPKGANKNRHLAVTLENCGSGVSQIIAIFACAVTRRDAVLIVDEINSFLHPLAVKDLLSVLATEYSSNQYIISSHSSEVISHPSVDKILSVEQIDGQSIIQNIIKHDIDQMRSSMRSLGVSMSDVLGSDFFMWVEGPTEVVSFPNLYRKHRGYFPANVRVASVDATGDFESKKSDSRTVIRLYERVSKLAAPLHQGQVFLLDREGYREETVNEIVSSTRKKLSFIKRRCLENYAIDPAGIAEILNNEIEGEIFDIASVENFIIEIASESKIPGSNRYRGDISDPTWLAEIDGARLLKETFARISENRVEFRKVTHTPQILQNRSYDDISDLIESIDERLSHLI